MSPSFLIHFGKNWFGLRNEETPFSVIQQQQKCLPNIQHRPSSPSSSAPVDLKQNTIRAEIIQKELTSYAVSTTRSALLPLHTLTLFTNNPLRENSAKNVRTTKNNSTKRYRSLYKMRRRGVRNHPDLRGKRINWGINWGNTRGRVRPLFFRNTSNNTATTE